MLGDNKLGRWCCISHHFYKSASQTPQKIAVIHATKFATQVPQIDDPFTTNNEFPATKPLRTNPPLYEGDVCFTFSQILWAVDSLAYRLRTILDGGDDPSLLRPNSGVVQSHISGSSNSSSSDVEQSTEFQNTYTPRIVGIHMIPSVEYIISVLSVLRCGEAFMPLDPSWPKERKLSIVSSSKAHLIIECLPSTDGSHSHQLDKSHSLVNCCSIPVLYISMNDNLHESSASSHLAWPCENEKLRHFCYLMHTSGSTGNPKGVCGTEAGLLNRYLWMQALYPLHGEELLLFKTSVSFIDHLQEFLGALLSSCTLVIPPFAELKENISSIVEYLQAYSINRLVCVPSLMRAILPALRSPLNRRIQCSLQLLILSGEVLHLSLWDVLSKLLPETSILNLYGSTEVSGDCTYFDCKRLPLILESEVLSSVPIGLPIPNCDVVLLAGEDGPHQGEIYVGGLCVASGYISYPSIMPLDHVKLPKKDQYYFKTGDFAKQLQSGDLVILGRKDRTIKVNGQRIALEEIESTLRRHQDVIDAAVICRKGKGEDTLLEAYLVTRQDGECGDSLKSSIRSWMAEKVPLAMIPNRFIFMESFPMSSTGKVDYKLLSSSLYSMGHVSSENKIQSVPCSDLLQVIKKAFCDALRVEKVSNDDDFFAIGGDSIAAAQVSHNIGINMRLLYTSPSPLKLQMALVELEFSPKYNVRKAGHLGVDMMEGSKLGKSKQSRTSSNTSADNHHVKHLKDFYLNSKGVSPWISSSTHVPCSFSRCNKVVHGGESERNSSSQASWSHEIPKGGEVSMRELWKVNMESCVDASPLVVFREKDAYLFIGSHSHKFLCINATSGSIQWEIKLEGRVECSAAILGDFSQVVVGCYQGNIYFLDSLNGRICWTFRTGGEVKSEPVVDNFRHLVWCGSYDHNLYALDYRSYQCIYKLPCGGSIYGSPAIDQVHNMLYVASTKGIVTSISVKDLPFSTMWQQDLGAPVFGSLSINSCNGNVICCLVNGHVVALDMSGSLIWMGVTGGPIFAGPCISHTLPSQVLVCSRDGSIYSFELENGDLLWNYNVGQPITSAAYIEENLHLVSNSPHLSDRLVCVCGSTGSIYLLRISFETDKETSCQRQYLVREVARFDLQGDIFSSPVMIGGRIFIGSRDDCVHCIEIVDLISKEE